MDPIPGEQRGSPPPPELVKHEYRVAKLQLWCTFRGTVEGTGDHLSPNGLLDFPLGCLIFKHFTKYVIFFIQDPLKAGLGNTYL